MLRTNEFEDIVKKNYLCQTWVLNKAEEKKISTMNKENIKSNIRRNKHSGGMEKNNKQ